MSLFDRTTHSIRQSVNEDLQRVEANLREDIHQVDKKYKVRCDTLQQRINERDLSLDIGILKTDLENVKSYCIA